MRLKNRLFLLIILLLFVFMLTNTTYLKNGIENGIKICVKVVIPSLFVFIMMSNIILETIVSEPTWKFSPKWLILALGSVCGFPSGAIACEKFLERRIIQKEDAEKLLPFCNNASPSFVIGIVGFLVGNVKVGVIIFLAVFISALLLVISIKCEKQSITQEMQEFNFSSIFSNSLELSIKSISTVCASIILFAALLEILKNKTNKTIFCIGSLFLEISNAVMNCNEILHSFPMINIGVLGFICAWSGICVHFQIFSVSKSIKVKYFRFLILKFFQGLLAMLFSIIGYKIFI